jgi:Protein of unknown function (DUF2934)
VTLLDYRQTESKVNWCGFGNISSKNSKRFKQDGADIDSPSQIYRDAAVPNQPTHQEIAVRADELFLKRGLAPGRKIEDWLQAEKELVDEKKPRK